MSSPTSEGDVCGRRARGPRGRGEEATPQSLPPLPPPPSLPSLAPFVSSSVPFAICPPLSSSLLPALPRPARLPVPPRCHHPAPRAARSDNRAAASPEPALSASAACSRPSAPCGGAGAGCGPRGARRCGRCCWRSSARRWVRLVGASGLGWVSAPATPRAPPRSPPSSPQAPVCAVGPAAAAPRSPGLARAPSERPGWEEKAGESRAPIPRGYRGPRAARPARALANGHRPRLPRVPGKAATVRRVRGKSRKCILSLKTLRILGRLWIDGCILGVCFAFLMESREDPLRQPLQPPCSFYVEVLNH